MQLSVIGSYTKKITAQFHNAFIAVLTDPETTGVFSLTEDLYETQLCGLRLIIRADKQLNVSQANILYSWSSGDINPLDTHTSILTIVD